MLILLCNNFYITFLKKKKYITQSQNVLLFVNILMAGIYHKLESIIVFDAHINWLYIKFERFCLSCTNKVKVFIHYDFG